MPRFQKNREKMTEKAIYVLYGIAILLWLAFWGGVVYVAWHFISHYW